MLHEPRDTIQEMLDKIKVLEELEEYLDTKITTAPYRESIIYHDVLFKLHELKDLHVKN